MMHLRHEFVSIILHFFDVFLLSFELLLCMFQLLVFIPESVYFCLQFVRFLFFDRSLISARDLFNLLKTGVRKSVSIHRNLNQSGVFVESGK